MNGRVVGPSRLGVAAAWVLLAAGAAAVIVALSMLSDAEPEPEWVRGATGAGGAALALHALLTLLAAHARRVYDSDVPRRLRELEWLGRELAQPAPDLEHLLRCCR